MPDPSEPVFQKPAEPYDPRGRLDPAGFARHVQFRTVPPSPALTSFIEHFWIIRWDGSHGHYNSPEVMHRPYVDVFLSAQESGIQGTFRGKRTYSAAGSGRILGIRFRPGAFHAFWPGAMADLQDKVVPLAQVFPWADAPGIRAILALDDDAAISAMMAHLSPPPPDETIVLINEIITPSKPTKACTPSPPLPKPGARATAGCSRPSAIIWASDSNGCCSASASSPLRRRSAPRTIPIGPTSPTTSAMPASSTSSPTSKPSSAPPRCNTRRG